MELRQLKYFVAVAKEKQFVKAAKLLFVSQSALSQQIMILEAELGVELFDKQKRKVSRIVELTEVGAMFYKEAIKILDLSEKSKEKVEAFKNENKSISLGTYRMLNGNRIIENLNFLNGKYPNVKINLLEFETHLDVQDQILMGNIDYGITVKPLKDERLEALFEQKSVLKILVSKNNPLSKRESLKLRELKNENWVEISPKIHPIYKLIESFCEKAGFVRHEHIVQEVSSLELVCHFVNNDKGIAFVPSFLDTSKFENLVKRKIDDDFFEFEQCLVGRR